MTFHISSHPNLDGEGNSGVLTLTRRPNAGRRRRIGNNANMGRQTKLFGGSLEEYLEETNQVILALDIHCFVVRAVALPSLGEFAYSLLFEHLLFREHIIT